MSVPPIPPFRSPITVAPPKQNNVWIVVFRVIQSLTLLSALILLVSFLFFARKMSEVFPSPTPTATPDGTATALPADLTLNLVPPEAYQFSEKIELDLQFSSVENPKDVAAELLKPDGSAFKTPIKLDITNGKVVIPASSYVGEFQVKAFLSDEPSVSAITSVTIAEPDWDLMYMTVKPAIPIGSKTAIAPDVTKLSFINIPSNLGFTLGSDAAPRKQGDEIPAMESFASADGSRIEMVFPTVMAADGNAFRHTLPQEVIVAKKADGAITTGTFNQYPVSNDANGQLQEKIILNNLSKCQDGLWSLGKDEAGYERGLAVGYVSLQSLPNFLKDVQIWQQSFLPPDIKKAFILRPTPNAANIEGCGFDAGAPGIPVFKLDGGDDNFARVAIWGYYKVAVPPAQ